MQCQSVKNNMQLAKTHFDGKIDLMLFQELDSVDMAKLFLFWLQKQQNLNSETFHFSLKSVLANCILFLAL